MSEPSRDPRHKTSPGQPDGVPSLGAIGRAYFEVIEDQLDIEDANAALRKGGRLIPLEELEAEFLDA